MSVVRCVSFANESHAWMSDRRILCTATAPTASRKHILSSPRKEAATEEAATEEAATEEAATEEAATEEAEQRSRRSSLTARSPARTHASTSRVRSPDDDAARMSALTRDARWRTAILALRATHSTKAFDETELSEEDRSEEDRSAEGSFPKISEESIFLFSGSFFWEG